MAPLLQRHYSPSSLLRAAPPSCCHSALFLCPQVIGPTSFRGFLLGAIRTSPVSIVSLLPCRRHYPAGVSYFFSQTEITHAVFADFRAARPPDTNPSLTRPAQRSLTLQPGNSLISLALSLSVGFSISITLHAATPAIRLRRSGTSLNLNDSHPMDHDSISSGHTNTRPDPFASTRGSYLYYTNFAETADDTMSMALRLKWITRSNG
jgi:hypothetical protein